MKSKKMLYICINKKNELQIVINYLKKTKT